MNRSLKACALSILIPSIALAQNPCEKMPLIQKEVEAIRQITFKHPVGCRAVDRQAFEQFQESQYRLDGGVERLHDEEIAYKLLGLIPDNYEYTRCLSKEATSSVLATYDPAGKQILIPTWRQTPDDILIHEATHALQDQYFNLYAIQRRANRSTDTALAAGALIEGDAMNVQNSYLAAHPAEDTADVQSADAGECSLPPLVSLQADFPYSFGTLFVSKLLRDKGWSGVDENFKAVPQTTSFIIHRNAKPAQNTPHLLKQKVAREERLGEFTTALLLRSELGAEGSYKQAKNLASDIFRLFRTPRKATIEWQTEWETEDSAQAFLKAWVSNLGRRFAVHLESAAYLEFESGSFKVQISKNERRVTCTIER